METEPAKLPTGIGVPTFLSTASSATGKPEIKVRESNVSAVLVHTCGTHTRTHTPHALSPLGDTSPLAVRKVQVKHTRAAASTSFITAIRFRGKRSKKETEGK